GGAEGNRVRADAAAHPQRQDHAAPAQGARARAARGRHFDTGVGRMSDTTSPKPVSVPRELAAAMLRDMVRIRRFEERCADLYGQQKIRGFLHLYIGEEAVAV